MAEALDAMVAKDLDITARALAKATIAVPERSHFRKAAEDFMTMAKAYHDDAKYFRDQGELEKALAVIYYAHAWLDAGARLGFFDVGLDDKLFCLAE
jgi:hypothetical protein